MNMLANVVAPWQPTTPPKKTVLVDTSSHEDAVLIGHDGPVAIDELGGLLAILKTDASGEHTLILTGCEGEVEVPGYALSMLVSELRRAGVGV